MSNYFLICPLRENDTHMQYVMISILSHDLATCMCSLLSDFVSNV